MRWVLICYPSGLEYREATQVTRCGWMDNQLSQGSVVWLRDIELPVVLDRHESSQFLKQLEDDEEVFLLVNEDGSPRDPGGDRASMNFKSLSTGQIVATDASTVQVIGWDAHFFAQRKSTGHFRSIDGIVQ